VTVGRLNVVGPVGCAQRVLDCNGCANDRVERAPDRIALVRTEAVVGEGEPGEPCARSKLGAAVITGEAKVTVAAVQVRFRLHV
jgi:hypothetical protein